ncbi:C-glycoside deglycosidase beta subunit domain-containing protein [Neorhizobium alkalisoli]|uniref:C-glycoside deglycosidase beta subunit domain-containing protein n=1 Tax=Neorhizobium alkalisoli TaxID=528178 RepID=UPI000CFA298E|nr:DUF6379 domain-containing protein [Neorhizobium alkalisoli]
MMFDKVIDPGTLVSTPEGFTIGIRIPWYRALPLSTIEVNLLKVDGQEIPLETLFFNLNGKRRTLVELETIVDETWFITDTAVLEVMGYPLEPSSEHEVEAVVAVRPPYLKGGMRRVGHITRIMKAN